MKAIFRLAELKDVEQLCKMRILMQVEIKDMRNVSVNLEYEDILRNYFKTAIGDGTYVGIVAEAGEILVGAVGMTIYHKPPSLNQKSGLLGYVTNVYTDVKWRRRGLAGEMMKMLVAEASRLGVVRMHLGATEAGKGVYERAGFVKPKYQHYEIDLAKFNMTRK